jgi:hypothetical protein
MTATLKPYRVPSSWPFPGRSTIAVAVVKAKPRKPRVVYYQLPENKIK